MIAAGAAIIALKGTENRNREEEQSKEIENARLKEQLEAQKQREELIVENAILGEKIKARTKEAKLLLNTMYLQEQLKIKEGGNI